MNIPLLSVLLLASLPLMADTAPPAPPSATDPTSEALPILKAHYPGFADLHWKSSDQLKDLVARSDGGIQLLSQDAAPSVPIITAVLPGNIIYWRLASFTPETNWADLGAQLDQWSQQGALGIILDVRSSTAPDDLAGAAQVAAFFTPDQTLPFAIQGSSPDAVPAVSFHPAQPFHQPVVVLINHETNGAAELLADVLEQHGALLIGKPTPGKIAAFSQQTLTSGQVLRYIGAYLTLGTAGSGSLWNHPVTPDIEMAANEQTEKSALALIEQHGVLDVIHEAAERHRLSEASLVQGVDPEWDDYLLSREKKPDAPHPAAPPLQDVVLISALDSLKAIQLSQRHATSPSEPDALPQATPAVR